jgi:hypothetical protein
MREMAGTAYEPMRALGTEGACGLDSAPAAHGRAGMARQHYEEILEEARNEQQRRSVKLPA